MIDELKELNDTFFKIFDELKEAQPCLTGDAYQVIASKILEQYKIEYDLISLKCSVQTEREISKLQERYDTLVPRRWRGWRTFFRWRQNYAQTLIDIEVSKEAEAFFADCEKRLAEGENTEEEHKETEEERIAREYNRKRSKGDKK